MKNNKFIALVAILSQLTGISAKAADTPKVPSDSVKTAESKKSKNPNKQKADTPKISSGSVKTAESEKTKNPNKQKKKKMENRNDVSSEGGYENLYPYGLWGLHEILSLCGGDSWWKYPSYLSVLKNCGRLFSSEEDESMDTQLKKMEQQAAELKKQADKQEADEIKNKFKVKREVEVYSIKNKIKKIQKYAKKKYENILSLKNEKAKKIQASFRKGLANYESKRELLKFDDNNTIANLLNVFTFCKEGYVENDEYQDFNDFILKDKIINRLNINTQEMINNFKARYNPGNCCAQFGIYDIVNVDSAIMKDVLLLIGEDNFEKNHIRKSKFRKVSEKSEKLIERLDHNELQFFIVFGAGIYTEGLDAHLVCCRKFGWTEKFIRSEAEKMKMSDVKKILELFIESLYDLNSTLLEYCIEQYPEPINF